MANDLDRPAKRKEMIDLVKQAFHTLDRARDQFAADKDEEAVTRVSMARCDLDNALRLANVYRIGMADEPPAGDGA